MSCAIVGAGKGGGSTEVEQLFPERVWIAAALNCVTLTCFILLHIIFMLEMRFLCSDFRFVGEI